jgi:hypothetical protein
MPIPLYSVTYIQTLSDGIPSPNATIGFTNDEALWQDILAIIGQEAKDNVYVRWSISEDEGETEERIGKGAGGVGGHRVC